MAGAAIHRGFAGLARTDAADADVLCDVRPDYDLMQMQGGIAAFCETYGIGGKMAWKLQLCAKELTQALLSASQSVEIDIDLSVEYSEADGGVRLDCAYRGAACNPMKDAAGDDQPGIVILRNTAKSIHHTFSDGVNRLSIIL